MPLIVYTPLPFRKSTLETISNANRVIETFRAQGFTLTVRQIYYQFIGHNLFPDDRRWSWTGSRWVRNPKGTKNADPNYKHLQVAISKGRLAGLVDWEAIEDRTRRLVQNAHWTSGYHIINDDVNQYAINKWLDQDYAPEVWVEKEALIGVVESACAELDVPYFACRGYVSQSAQWRAGIRLSDNPDRESIVFHLGDHDPSGIHMTEDNEERLRLFGDPDIRVKRLALNWDQIEQYDPPPDPAKQTDSRFKRYVEDYGTDLSWELDALDPSVIVNLIRDAVLAIRDETRWKAAVKREERVKRALRKVRTDFRKRRI